MEGGLSMVKNNKEQEDKSKVKLYKTKHGWFSALTRFFKIFEFRSKREVKITDFNDLDSLKNMYNSDTADAYKKGAAIVATLLGIGATGAANPIEAHAATTTVDQSSQVIGSGLTSISTSASSSTSTSQSKTSTSESITSTSNVSSGSTSSSTSTSESNISTSESTTSNSNVSSGSISTSTSAASSQSASTSTSLTSSSMSGSLANSETSLSSNDDFETFTKEASNNTATTAFSANQSPSLRTTTENITNGTIVLFNSSFIQTNATEEEGTANVSTAGEFINAIKDSNISTIKLTANIDLRNLSKRDYYIPLHSFTIDGSNGNDKYELNIGYNCIWLKNTTSKQYTTIIKSVKLYTANRGGFAMTGAHTLIYDNVDATGGTAVRPSADSFATDLKVFEIRGNTTINGVNSYQYNGNTYKTGTFSVNDYATLIYGGNNLKIDGGASLTINNSITPFDITILGNDNKHVVSVGNNASLKINNTYNYRKGSPWYKVANIALTKGNASFIAGENSNINLNTSGTNIYFLNDGSNNTATFSQGTNATLSGNRNFYFGSFNNTININDPAHLTFLNKTKTGTTFSTNSSVTVNANNTNVVVTRNGAIIESNYFGNNQSTVKGTKYTTGTITDEQKDGKTSVKKVMADINKSGTTKVEYNGKTIHSGGSTSVSVSESTSASVSASESASTSLSQSESASTSLSQSESASTSLSQSESASTSLSQSESTSTSISNSSSINGSESTSGSQSPVTPFPDNSGSGSMSTNGSGNSSASLSLSITNSTNASGLENTNTSVADKHTTVDLTAQNSVENSNVNKASQQNKKLPQTGNASQTTAELLGLMSLEAVLLLLMAKKKNHNEDK